MIIVLVLFVSFPVFVAELEFQVYDGTVNITNGGRGCQSWASQEPHRHSFSEDSLFPIDGSAEEARNFCRNLDNDNVPWCYTSDKYRRWDYCDLQITQGPGLCGGVITDESGMISSVDSDSDGQYDLDRDCLWTLVADETRFIKFHVLTFDLELSYTCELDMLQIYEDTITHGRFCGPYLPPVIVSRSRVLFVRFYSNNYLGSGLGFTANFSHVEEGLQEIPEEYGWLLCPADVDLMLYHGNVSTANDGHDCWNWNNLPRDIGYNHPDQYFVVDGSKGNAKNYCRSLPGYNVPTPWCYSKYNNGRQWCNMNICRESTVTEIHTTETTENNGWTQEQTNDPWRRQEQTENPSSSRPMTTIATSMTTSTGSRISVLCSLINFISLLFLWCHHSCIV